MYSIEEIDVVTFPPSLKLKFEYRVILVNVSLFCSKTEITGCVSLKRKIEIADKRTLARIKMNETIGPKCSTDEFILKRMVNPLMPGGQKRSYILKQTCSSKPQVSSSMATFFLSPGIEELNSCSRRWLERKHNLVSY